MPQSTDGDGVDGTAGLFDTCRAGPRRRARSRLQSGRRSLLDGLQRAIPRVFQVSAPSGRKDGGWAASQTEALRSFRPDMVVLVVGSNTADSLAADPSSSPKQIAMTAACFAPSSSPMVRRRNNRLASFTGKIRGSHCFAGRSHPGRHRQPRSNANSSKRFAPVLNTPDFAGDRHGRQRRRDLTRSRGRSGQPLYRPRVWPPRAHHRDR